MRREKLQASTSKNHQQAPICAEFVRQMREVFGEDQVVVKYVKEGEVELGDKSCSGTNKD